MDHDTSAPPAGVWQLFRHEQEAHTTENAAGTLGHILERSLPSIALGTPYLLNPRFEYDLELNAFFHSANMLGATMSTRVGYAGNLVAFFNFLNTNRGNKDWRDTTAIDHEAYFGWRREDPAGARVAPSTWDREVAAANRFFTWQVGQGNLAENPIPQRQRRMYRYRSREPIAAGTTPATRSHGSGRARVEWLPSASYRRWRDVGLRGYRIDGRPDPQFRGRWATRNATFADMLIRTGLRLSEQASLLASELPGLVQLGGFHRLFLTRAIAKGGSERWVYVPSSVLRALHEYINTDRLEVVERARSAGRYRLKPDSLILEPDGRHARLIRSSERIRTSLLTPAERRLTYIESAAGVSPACLWLSEAGDPISVSTWKHIFGQANVRCGQRGVDLSASAHTLRHSFAVITLEHLQRGHIAALQSATSEQRQYYVRTFGDPLDWVRRLLGHRSVETTQIYLHAIAELEMRTRLTLIPHEWDDSRDPNLLAPGAS